MTIPFSPLPTKKDYLASFSPFKNGIKGLCPRCQKTSMFKSPLKIKTTCNVCGLDYSFAGPADGPSFFAMSFIMLTSSVWTVFLQIKYEAPLWVHAVTTIPYVFLVGIGLLHLFRGWFVSAEYFIKIRDNRLSYEAE